MEIAALSTAWNDLRNAALGRSTKPLVSAPLADHVASEYSAWRAFYETAQPEADSLDDGRQLDAWAERYGALLKAVRVELPTVADELATQHKGILDTLIDESKKAAAAAVDTVEVTVAVVVAVGLAVLLAPFAYRAVKRGDRR
jgi:hypothetical protein